MGIRKDSTECDIPMELNVYIYISMKVLVIVMATGVCATFNKISVISWWSVLLTDETTNLLQLTDKLYHQRLYVELDSLS
jgi:hypothetical protein